MPGALDQAIRPRRQARGKSLDRRSRHDGIATCRHHQDRLIDLRRVIRGTKCDHRIKRRIQPGYRWRINPKCWICLDDPGIARITPGVGGERISRKTRCPRPIDVAAWNVARPKTREAQRTHQDAQWQRGAGAGEIDHRRNDDSALKPPLAGMRDPQQDRAAHRVRQRKIGWWAIGEHHAPHERLDVDLEIRKTFDMALARIRQLPRRVPLPPPVHDSDRKAALAQIAHRLEIFFDELAASGEDAHRSLAASRRIPAREAQLHPVRCRDLARDDVVGNRIAGNRNQLHGASSARPRRIVLLRFNII